MGILSGRNSEVSVSVDTQPRAHTLPSSATIASTAIAERQLFLENMYYGTSPLQVTKAITAEMKAEAIRPIEECIRTSANEHSTSSIQDSKALPTLVDWQARKTQSLSYGDFLSVVAQEAKQDVEIDKDILKQEYVMRAVTELTHLVDIKDETGHSAALEKAARYAVAPPKSTTPLEDPLGETISAVLDPSEYTEEQRARYTNIIERFRKSNKITGQMKQWGIDYTIQCYKQAQEVASAVSPRELEIAETNIRSLRRSDLRDELRARVRAKREILKQKGIRADAARTGLTSELSAEMLNKQYNEAWKYLNSQIPPEKRRFWDKAPNTVLKLAIALRRVLPVENAEVLAQMWWQLRLGGARAKDIYAHLEREWPQFVKEHNLKRYTEHLADNYLSSEAAGFEFQSDITIPETASPNKLLFQTMKDLIKLHIPKNQDSIRFTLLDGDVGMRKINVPYHEGITDDEIRINITSVLAGSKWAAHELDDRDRAKLSYVGYSATDRAKDSSYAQIYKGFGRDTKGKEYEGDYLIQVGGTYGDSRDPRSLFAVDSHKAAVQLKFQEPGKVSVTTRYSHPHFDGVPAQSHSSLIYQELKKLKVANESPKLLPDDRGVGYFLNEQVAHAEEEKRIHPLIEARADFDDFSAYKKIAVGGEKTVLTPTDIRSLVLARANGIQYYQQLVAGKAEGSYFLRNPNANNVQPVVIAPINLHEKNRKEWVASYRQSVERAKEGVGDVALFSAITGTREGPLALMGKVFNPQVTNMLSHAQGMISPVPGNEGGISFTTADSNAYRPSKIDLNDAEPSMGAIGMYLRKEGSSHYTVRLLPSQAQVHFRDAALRLLPAQSTPDQQRKVLSEFTKIIKAWDKLVGGEGSGISLDKFEAVRDSVFNTLIENDLLDVQKLGSQSITTSEHLQRHMNEVLQKAAHDIFSPAKIEQAKKELMALLGK